MIGLINKNFHAATTMSKTDTDATQNGSLTITDTTQNGSVTILNKDEQLWSSDITENDIVKINVGGLVYETLQSTLSRFPGLLGDKARRNRYYMSSRSMMFFDRDRQAFEAILNYYRTGYLIRPPSVPMVIFMEEIMFFELEEKARVQVQEDEGYNDEPPRELPKNKTLKKIWQLFEYPDTSLSARLLAFWSGFVIALSITVFCIETLPTLNEGSKNERSQPWFSIELGCICWFTFEYIIRLISSPNKWKFIKSFMSVVDLLSILPYFISLSINYDKNAAPISVLWVFRLVRVFRIFKLSRHSLGMRILGHTLVASKSELMMLIFFLILGVIVFSSAVFYCEEGQEDTKFRSILDAFWYSLVTMTTVGYGDIVPTTPHGKVVGSLCALVGGLTLTLPVPVIVSKFEFFYKRDRFSYGHRKSLADTGKSRSHSSYSNASLDSTRRQMLQGTDSITQPLKFSPDSPKKKAILIESPDTVHYS